MKYYDFVDREGPIGAVVIVEGTERVLAERALTLLLDRLLPSDLRDLNLQRFDADEVGDGSRVGEALGAMPFLADRRVVVVRDAQVLLAAPRRALLAVARDAPEGATLIVLDLVSPRSQRPVGLGSQLGRDALRIDTTAGPDERARFVRETLAELGAKASRQVIEALAAGDADLAAVRNDLEKLALVGTTIALDALEEETLTAADPKPFKYASAVAAGDLAQALEIVQEMFAGEPRGAAIPLLSALANECLYVWELARPGGRLPARIRWRARTLEPLARRIGERRARAGYERAVRGIESVVTGRVGADPGEARAMVERISVELSGLSRR